MLNLDSFKSKNTLKLADKSYVFYDINAVAGAKKLPYSLKVLLENLLRTEDGINVTKKHVQALANWQATEKSKTEIQFTPARVLMQDFTGVPCVVDLATMREAVKNLGGDPDKINPLAPAEMVIDHSVQVDDFGTVGALEHNIAMEYSRNKERYQFLRWGQTAFENFKVVPPGTGIVHQVNLEYLARTIMVQENSGELLAYPDTCVGTDSHTTMINGIGVLAWGVGGIEAEAAMLGQAVSMLIPEVVGFKLVGSIPPGVTATDVVLTITEMLRKYGVVGKFVEFYGEGVAEVPLANRATIGNMSPEFGSTAAIFPIDQVTLDYLHLSGRTSEHIDLVEHYAKAQGLWHDPAREIIFSQYLELDLATIVPSIAGPKRPQDRIELKVAKKQFRDDLKNQTVMLNSESGSLDESLEESFPASDVPSFHSQDNILEIVRNVVPSAADGCVGRSSNQIEVVDEHGKKFVLDHGAVVIASITSCTNTSNPSVMVAAAVLARNAVEKGLTIKPWVKTSLAPGSKVVTAYYEKSGLDKYLNQLGFNTVGYGCTTCIGNSGPLDENVSAAIAKNDLSVVSVLSGNRNFEGRINSDVKMNYLVSPPLVIAYALAGSMDFDFVKEPLGFSEDGAAVYLADIWPNPNEVEHVVANSIDRDMFVKNYSKIFAGDSRWQALDTPAGNIFQWDENSTYVKRAPYFDGMTLEKTPVEDIVGARVLLKLGDSVTTDHISPAGSFKSDSPAGKYLLSYGVQRKDFNSYGSRRGNHEVMVRGTFANIRLRNLLLPGVEGGYTVDFTKADMPKTSVYDAAVNYAKTQTPLIIFAGKEYGSGSSRDWAAKGTSLLGVKAVIAESFERIHRSNLLGMGVLPLQFLENDNAQTLQIVGNETFSISGITVLNFAKIPETVRITAVSADGKPDIVFDALVRIDTPGEADYYTNGGILQYVLRLLLKK